MAPEQIAVEQLADRATRSAAMTALAGGVTATALRTMSLTPAAFNALLGGLKHQDSRVRWWSIQILDHAPDARAFDAIAPLLDDPVPRVRRNAAHALGCVACKPDWEGALSAAVLRRLEGLSRTDPNGKVRGEALRTLSCVSRASALGRAVAETSGSPI